MAFGGSHHACEPPKAMHLRLAWGPYYYLGRVAQKGPQVHHELDRIFTLHIWSFSYPRVIWGESSEYFLKQK